MNNSFRKNIITIGLAAIILIVLALAYRFGDSENKGLSDTKTTMSDRNTTDKAMTAKAENETKENETKELETEAVKETSVQEILTENETAAFTENTENAAANTTTENAQSSNQCIVSIECSAILSRYDSLNKSVQSVIPKDGIILSEYHIQIKDTDTVYEVLKRACDANNIKLDTVFTPVYNSTYIEGIANIYEFDAGSLSGWIFTVNGNTLGKASSEVRVSPGDAIVWHYTCDLGKDVQ